MRIGITKHNVTFLFFAFATSIYIKLYSVCL